MRRERLRIQAMIGCPGCRRRSISRRELLAASIDGTARCPACGEHARLDNISRCMVGCVLALLVWMGIFFGNLFYSGYLFLFSTLAVLLGWRLLTVLTLPVITLEKAPGGVHANRRQSLIAFVIMVLTAIGIDALLSYRSAADRLHAAAVSSSATARPD